MLTDAQVKHMVDRFLGWKLPEHFRPDAGISFKPTFNDHLPQPMKHNPTGTNLFDADQAEAMVRHMLDGMPAAKTIAELDADPAAGNMFWNNADPEMSCDYATELAREDHGVIMQMQRGLALSHVYAVVLPASPDADSDDDREMVFATREEAAAWLATTKKADAKAEAARQRGDYEAETLSR